MFRNRLTDDGRRRQMSYGLGDDFVIYAAQRRVRHPELVYMAEGGNEALG